MGQHQGRLQALPLPQPVDGAEALGNFSLGCHDTPHAQVGLCLIPNVVNSIPSSSPMDVIWNLSGGIRKLNNDIARGVSKWYRDTWWQEANIVATDFFLRWKPTLSSD